MERLSPHDIEEIRSFTTSQRMAVESALNINREGTLEERQQLARDLWSIEQDVATNLLGADAYDLVGEDGNR